jgi:hypothetical protein
MRRAAALVADGGRPAHPMQLSIWHTFAHALAIECPCIHSPTPRSAQQGLPCSRPSKAAAAAAASAGGSKAPSRRAAHTTCRAAAPPQQPPAPLPSGGGGQPPRPPSQAAAAAAQQQPNAQALQQQAQFRALQTSSGGRTPLKYASPWGTSERRAALVSRVREASSVEVRALDCFWSPLAVGFAPTESARTTAEHKLKTSVHRPIHPHQSLVSVWAANRQLLGPAELAVMFHQLARVADPAKISLKALEMSKVGWGWEIMSLFGRGFRGVV